MKHDDGDAALLALLEHLAGAGYRFVTPTRRTHRRVTERMAEPAADLRGAFGWNLAFEAGLLPPALLARLVEARHVEAEGALWRSRVRVASVGERLFVHSASAADTDAVFFGPDSYRFVRFLEAELKGTAVRRLVDIGTGSGVGAIMAAGMAPGARLAATDVNPLALRFARINARHAGVEIELTEGKGLDGVEGDFDLAITNPPFIADPDGRLYRDGGGARGAGLSIDWALAAAKRVVPGGRVLLYSGSAIVDGQDGLEAALREGLAGLGCTLRYGEIDPDIFGEQVGGRGYEDVERIAAIGAVIERRGAD